MIDSHCHLADTKFDADLGAVLQRAEQAGVTTLVTIADSLKEGEKCLSLAEKNEQLLCTIGVHPHNAKEWDAESSARLRSLLTSSKKVRAVGEIGLDFHYNLSPRTVQRSVFRE